MDTIFFRKLGINKYLVALLLIACGLGGLSAQEPSGPVADLQTTFEKKDLPRILPDLSDRFAIAGHTGAAAERRLQQILDQYPIQKIILASAEETSAGKLLNCRFEKSDGTAVDSKIVLDQSGKIRYVELFDRLYGMHRLPTSRLRATIPFENRDGAIFLTVRVNDFKRPLRLLFDTGANGMAIRRSLADSIGVKVSRSNEASVVGGNLSIEVADNNTVLLDTLKLEKQSIGIFPMMNREGDGIIGNSLMRSFIVHIDYDKSELSLYDFGDHQYPENGHVVPFSMPDGLILLSATLFPTEQVSANGRFIFDTGAGYNLICFRPFVRKNNLLLGGFKAETQGVTNSLGMSSPTFIGKSIAFQVDGGETWKGMPVTLMGGNSANEKWNPGVDGSIGVRMLSRYNITINLATNELFFSPNSCHDLPQDFVLRDILFGWDSARNLKVVHDFSGASNSALKGQKVESIDGISAKQILKHPKQIDLLKKRPVGKVISLSLTGEQQITM